MYAKHDVTRQGDWTFLLIRASPTHKIQRVVGRLLGKLLGQGAELVGEVVQYGDTYRLAYVRAPEGIIVGLAEELG